MDVIYLGILALASAATCGLLKACEWLMNDRKGGG